MGEDKTKESKTLLQEYEAIENLPKLKIWWMELIKWGILIGITIGVVMVINESKDLTCSIIGVICELAVFILLGIKWKKKSNNSDLYAKVKNELNDDDNLEHIKYLRELNKKQIESQQKYGARQMKIFTTLISWFGITSLFQAWGKELYIWFPVIFIVASIALIAVQRFLLREDKLEKLRILDNVLMSIELEKK